MNLDLRPEDKTFEDECRAFFETYLTEEMRLETARGAGVWAEFDLAMRWQKILHEHGLIAPSWPKAYGGCEWSLVQRYIWDNLCAEYGAPRIPAMGIRMCGPVLMKYGTDAQKSRFLPRILSGEDVWCQGYSEPGAGSDLAALTCKAVRDGDEYVINGTKIWTTYAQFSNWIFCLVRTRDAGKPQAGISFLLVPMDAPGLTVSEIISISGDHEVNQVFFDDVRVPTSHLVGAENEGWTVAKYLLEHERGGSFAAGLKRRLAQIQAIAVAKATDLQFQTKISAAEIRVRSIDITEQRMISRLSNGDASGAEPSLLKLQGTEMVQELDELAIEALGDHAAPDYLDARYGKSNWRLAEPEDVPIMGLYLNNRAATIYGGSSEVQRNIMSKVVLGL